MLKVIERTPHNIEVEIDAPQGRILLVSCAEHGGMADRLTNPAWVCAKCQQEFTRVDAQRLIDNCYAEIRQQDKQDEREDRVRSDERLRRRLGKQ